ncbi:MAG: cyclic nucleotide-binding domain-containing protein, partial [Anaerolineae bacterium]
MAPDTIQDAEQVDRGDVATKLNSFAALKVMSPTDLNQLADKIIVRPFKVGDRLQEAQSSGDFLYLVESGALRETGKDSAGTVWWERTHNVGAAFSRQATYDGLFEETEVIALQEGRLFVIAPSDLSWAMGRQPALRQALIREPIAVRLRAMPMLAPLNDSQVRRLATIARVEEVNGGSPLCEPQLTGAETWFWFIDWGQVSVTYPSGVPPKTPRVITAGNAFHNAPEALGQIPPAVAQALYRCKLIRVPFSEMLALARIPAIYARLQLPPIIGFLETVAPFQGLNEEQLQTLASITAWEHYPAAQTVSQQGVRDNALRILQRGAAIIRTTDADGKERPRDYMAPGRFYGQSSLFRRERHETTVRAVRPDSVGSATGILTSPQGESDRAHASEPGATWFRIRSEDLIYLLHSDPGFWKDTHLEQKVKAEKKKHRKYKWQDEDEVLWYDGHRHVIVLLRSFLIPALPVVGMILLKLILQNWDINLTILTVALVSGMVAAPLTIWYVVDYLNDYFVVTSLRVTAREQVVLVYERRTEAPLDQVQDTTLRTDFWGGLFGYGNLKIKTASAASQIVFDHLPNPESVQALISEQRRRLMAEKLAEQREGLRMQLVKDLRLSLLSQVPDQTLPPGIKPPVVLSWWQKWLATLAKALHFVFFPFEFLLLRPLSWVTHIFAQRRNSPRNQNRDFGAGVLASWWITPDKTVWRKHWLILLQRVGQSFLVWLIVTAMLVATLRTWLPLPWLLPASLWLPATGWFWWKYEDWANDLYIVTNDKVIDIEAKPFGFGIQRREAGLDRIQNVTTELPTFWANALNYGNVVIRTAAADEGFTFDLVANPHAVQREIMKRLSAFRASRQQREATAQRTQQAYVL